MWPQKCVTNVFNVFIDTDGAAPRATHTLYMGFYLEIYFSMFSTSIIARVTECPWPYSLTRMGR